MNKLISKYILNNFNTVSFDIFDTLIERNVSKPSDIFRIVGEEIIGKDNAEEFCLHRKNAESKARHKQTNGEITLEQIYQELEEVYGVYLVELLKEKEINTEIKYCHRKKEMELFYEKCVSDGKRIFLISDMYLPKYIIEQMLTKSNIKGYKSVYVSNSFGKNKITGELFNIVLKENELNASEMIHIGDSIKADFIGAHKAGVKSILIRRKNRFERLIYDGCESFRGQC